MAVENVSFGIGTLPQKISSTVESANAIKAQQEKQGDKVEISSKKEKKKISKGQKLAFFVTSLLLAGGFGALTHKFITTRPSFVKKQMAKNLGRSLTADEIAKVEKNCKNAYTGWNFLDDVITGLIFL